MSVMRYGNACPQLCLKLVLYQCTYITHACLSSLQKSVVHIIFCLKVMPIIHCFQAMSTSYAHPIQFLIKLQSKYKHIHTFVGPLNHFKQSYCYFNVHFRRSSSHLTQAMLNNNLTCFTENVRDKKVTMHYFYYQVLQAIFLLIFMMKECWVANKNIYQSTLYSMVPFAIL